MPKIQVMSRYRLVGFILIAILTLLIASDLSISKAQSQGDQALMIPIIAPGSAYRQTNFVSDVPGLAFVQDPLLVNPWGISMTASSPFWIVNNGTSTTQLIRGDV